MSPVPVVPHRNPDPPASLVRRVERLARDLQRRHQELPRVTALQEFTATAEESGPALHLDDLTEIALLDPGTDNRFYQDRARLRADQEDTIVTSSSTIQGYEEYCRDYLGLGEPRWLRVNARGDPMHVARAIWEDRTVRRELIRRLRQGQLTHIHPHMGTLPVWGLAALLHHASRRPVCVLAPPPHVTTWANDKVEFASTVSRLFGPSLIPRTTAAWNLVNAAIQTRELAKDAKTVGLKIPDSAGGEGNVILSAEQVTGCSLQEVETLLRDAVKPLHWDGQQPLLISAWESNVICSPSAQLWIPPGTDHPPVVEGLFTQTLAGHAGLFMGNRPAELPEPIAAEISDRCWLLGRLFQLLGYVSRCSFDLLLLGDSLSNSRIEFIECNGRWGGTSTPMTLMNRIFGDWASQPFAVHVCIFPGLDRVPFHRLVEELGSDLFDVRTGEGHFILFNPGRMPTQSGVSVIGLASDWDSASEAAFEVFPRRLHDVVAKTSARQGT